MKQPLNTIAIIMPDTNDFECKLTGVEIFQNLSWTLALLLHKVICQCISFLVMILSLKLVYIYSGTPFERPP